jgi:hypothetical protein
LQKSLKIVEALNRRDPLSPGLRRAREALNWRFSEMEPLFEELRRRSRAGKKNEDPVLPKLETFVIFASLGHGWPPRPTNPCYPGNPWSPEFPAN